MPALKRPGVFLTERPGAPIPSINTVSGSIGAFVGVADRGPVAPTLISSFGDFTRLYGEPRSGGPAMAFDAYAYFANGGGPAYFTRATGVGAAASSRVLTDRSGNDAATLVVAAANPGLWGNRLYLEVSDTPGSGAPATAFDLTIYEGGTTSGDVVERFPNLNLDPSSQRFAPKVINNADYGSIYVRVSLPSVPSTATAPANLPAVQVGRQLVNGAEGAAVGDTDFGKALARLDTVGVPMMLTMPGASLAQQASALGYAQNRGDLFAILTLPEDVTDTAAALAAAATFPASSYGAVYWPNIVTSDPSSRTPGSTRIQTPGGAVMGLIALTDATRSIAKAPAGTGARLAGALSPTAVLSAANLDALNLAGVNAIRQIPGAGVVVMGARTLKQGSADRYVPVRRVLNYLKPNLVTLSEGFLFEINNPQMRAQLEYVLADFLRTSWRSGLLAGSGGEDSFYVDVFSTAADQDQGLVNINVGVALAKPAEFIVITIGQIEGGATATER